jgi:hypothetical protein
MNQLHRALDSLERNTPGLTVHDMRRVFGPMAVEGLFAHGYVRRWADDRFTLTTAGRRCLADVRTSA